ncbi:MAG: hypothetical protein ACI4IG_01940 [Eubacterium sp.]
MTEYITGGKGEGKTRMLFEASVGTADASNGHVIYVDSSDKLLKILPNNIRLINFSNYGLSSSTAFIGFLIGLCESDYDLTDVFVDSSINFVSSKTDTDDFFKVVDIISNKTGVNFHFAVTDESRKQVSFVAM